MIRYEEPEDDLLDKAIAVCKGCKSVSPYVFERMLMVDEKRAVRIFRQLENLHVLTNVSYEEIMGNTVLLGTVNAGKIRELTLN